MCLHSVPYSSYNSSRIPDSLSHFYKQATLTGAPFLSPPALIGTTKLPSLLLEPAVNAPRYRQTFVFSREREVNRAQGREPRGRLR